RPGTVLRREWNGQVQRVAVLTDGFVWNGKTYPSLSKVAFAITGTRWSGPKFFGLRDKPPKGSSPCHRKDPRHEEDSQACSLRDLYPRLDRPRARAGLQLARRPIRCFTSLYPQPSALGMDPAPSQIRGRGVLWRQHRTAGSAAAPGGRAGRQGRCDRRLQGRPPDPLAGG